jgi:serine/threonine protein kinase
MVAALSIWARFSATRRLYAAFMKAHTIDLSTPLPLFMVTTESEQPMALPSGWTGLLSRVHARRSGASRPATAAAREGAILSRLEATLPRPLSRRQQDGYWVVEVEKVGGQELRDIREEISQNPTKAARFFMDCLDLLTLAGRGRAHRDIRPDNILVRDGRTVLTDFDGRVGGCPDHHPGCPRR